MLDEVTLEQSRLTKTIKVPALQPGSYALVDIGADPATGNPYAYRDPFVLAIQVTDMPA